MCLHVCLSVGEYISGTYEPILTKFCVKITCGRGSVLLWRCCATLCNSGFMNDVTFSRNRRDTETWRLHRATTAMSDAAIPGRSLMSMNACYSAPVGVRSIVINPSVCPRAYLWNPEPMGTKFCVRMPDLEFSRLESWSRDVSRPVFTSLGLGLELQSLGLGTSESWSRSWTWNPPVSVSVSVLGLETVGIRSSSLMKRETETR